jgi:hypothetical protein
MLLCRVRQACWSDNTDNTTRLKYPGEEMRKHKRSQAMSPAAWRIVLIGLGFYRASAASNKLQRGGSRSQRKSEID